MKTRAATLVAAIVACSLFSGDLIAAPDDAEPAVDKCLTSPGEKTPPGSRWRYRTERGTGRQCWYLKTDSEKSARKAAAEAAVAEEPAAPPPRTKAAPARSLADARAEFARTQVEPNVTAAPAESAPISPPPVAVAEASPPSVARDASMMTPAAAARWPDPMSTAKPAASFAAPPTPAPAMDQSADVRPAPATSAPAAAPPQNMPRAVPPAPSSDKPLSLPMLITIIVGGLSVVGMMISMFFGWRASQPRLTPSAPMPTLDDARDQPRRPGDLYRERMRARAAGALKYQAEQDNAAQNTAA